MILPFSICHNRVIYYVFLTLSWLRFLFEVLPTHRFYFITRCVVQVDLKPFVKYLNEYYIV